MSYDVAIIGAGIVGAACAAELSRGGLKVVVIDASHAACGTTAAGMGHIVAMDDSEAQFALASRSRQLWSELAERLPSSSEYENCGTIWVAADEFEMEEVRRKFNFYTSRGSSAEVLDEDAIRELEPNLRDGLAGGLLVPGDGVVYQPAAAYFLLSEAVGLGTHLRTSTRVAEITDDGLKLVDGSMISAGKVVNAAGIGAPALSPELNIVPRKGHLAITERYPGFVSHQLIELGYLRSAHGTGTESVAFNVQPRATGQMLIGSSRQFGAGSLETDHTILNKMTARAVEYMPALRRVFVTRTWTGHRPATHDNLPYIGPIPGRPDVLAAAGHEGLGITTSLATAELIADEILDREPVIDPTPYLPSRPGAAAH